MAEIPARSIPRSRRDVGSAPMGIRSRRMARRATGCGGAHARVLRARVGQRVCGAGRTLHPVWPDRHGGLLGRLRTLRHPADLVRERGGRLERVRCDDLRRLHACTAWQRGDSGISERAPSGGRWICALLCRDGAHSTGARVGVSGGTGRTARGPRVPPVEVLPLRSRYRCVGVFLNPFGDEMLSAEQPV